MILSAVCDPTRNPLKGPTSKGWLSSFIFKVTVTRFELKDELSCLDVRICPESLVERVRTTMLSLMFLLFRIGGSKAQEDHLLAALRDISADQHQCSSGWLGHFSLEQVALLENIFDQYGQVPWNDLIKPLWTDVLSHVEEAWLDLDSGFIHPDEERLRWITSTLPRVSRNSLRCQCRRLLPLLAFPALGQ